MLGTHDLALFVLSGLLLNITPGPDVLYIAGRSATQGARAGAIAALGIGAGVFVHIGAAALGVSALLIASATAFAILKLAGAAYLVFVGMALLKGSAAEPKAKPAQLAPAPMRAIFVQGFFTNALNPKVALFFLAFLPQFIDADAPSKPLAFLLLGVIFNVNATFWNLFVAWSTARMTRAISTGAVAWFNRCIGAFFVYLGVRLALSER